MSAGTGRLDPRPSAPPFLRERRGRPHSRSLDRVVVGGDIAPGSFERRGGPPYATLQGLLGIGMP